jgi:hypothetical protein
MSDRFISTIEDLPEHIASSIMNFTSLPYNQQKDIVIKILMILSVIFIIIWYIYF